MSEEDENPYRNFTQPSSSIVIKRSYHLCHHRSSYQTMSLKRLFPIITAMIVISFRITAESKPLEEVTNYSTTEISKKVTSSPSGDDDDLERCGSRPPEEWEEQMDPGSKAFLSPIVFTGKLISISEDYAGRIATTFRVMRQIKNIGSRHGTVPVNLLPGAQVTLFFVTGRNRSVISQPPYCAVHLNKTHHASLRPIGKYVVYASSPLKSLVKIHEHHIHGQNLIPGNEYRHEHHSPHSSMVTNSTIDQQNYTDSQHRNIRSFDRQNNMYINYLSPVAPPDSLSKKTSRIIKKVICANCARAPQVRGMRGDLLVESKSTLILRCRIDGNPLPRIEWFRNGKKLVHKGRVSIYNKRRTSILEVRRALPSIDTGYYDCRASNAVAFEPVIARTRVIVMRPQVPVQSTEPIPEKWPTTPAPTSSFWSLSGKDRPFSGMPEWAVRPCPLPDFCLNKGQCFYYESVGEYVCQCAEGFKGMRCENKDTLSIVF